MIPLASLAATLSLLRAMMAVDTAQPLSGTRAATTCAVSHREGVLPSSVVVHAAPATAIFAGNGIIFRCENSALRTVKISRKVHRRVVSPACIAGVRTSLPNFSALCGLAKL